jgi:ankyrin repeat and MYND domain-containing protein 2
MPPLSFQGADVNSGKHEHNYTALHFAALSGSCDVCSLLLLAGAKANVINSVGRTASQMAAFVSNHDVVATINNFIPKSDVEHYTQIDGLQTEPHLSPALLDSVHKFIIQFNIHPVRIALNLQKYGLLNNTLPKLKKVLELMSEREMKRKSEMNEVMSFKYHYLSWVINEINKCCDHFQARKETQADGKETKDFVELFVKRVLKQNKDGQLDYLESTIRDCVREFPHRECTIFRQIVTQLANTVENGLTALDIVKSSINGQRGFQDAITFCSSCGQEKPDKKCSKCKLVQYCDRECQRLHWFMHKKYCNRLIEQSKEAAAAPAGQRPQIDATEVSQALKNLVTG